MVNLNRMSGNIFNDLIILLVFLSCCDKVLTNRESLFQRSVNSEYFIDKTLLLKEIFIGNTTKIIMAPRGFGKSTNFAMIKNFLEVEVDTNGVPVQKELSKSYRIFKENNLHIFKDKKYFHNHFGNYPVVFIDYSPLNLVESFEDFLVKYKEVVRNTFSEHKYLLKNTTLLRDNSERNLFEDFIEKKAKQDQMSISFKWLGELLNKHFNKPIFILIDEYDAIIKSFIFKENRDLIKISKLYGETEQNLLVSNNSIGILLTGELRLYRGDVSYFVNLGGSNLSHFYGITELEFEKLLEKENRNKEDIIKTKNKTENLFGGYIYFSDDQKLKLYRTESVIHYLKNTSENESKICRTEYEEGLKNMCHVKGLTEWLHILLSGKKVLHTHVELFEPIFHRKHISIINSVISHGTIEKATSSSTIFLTLLYYFGFLTPVDAKLRWFKIPNKSAQNELQRLFSDGTSDLFSYNVLKQNLTNEQQNKNRIVSSNFILNRLGLKGQTASSSKNFLDMLKMKCTGEKKNTSSTDEIKRKIAKWFLDEHLPF